MELSDLGVWNKIRRFQQLHHCSLYLQLNGTIYFHVV